MIAAWLLNRTHNDLSFVWYMMACAAVSLVFTLMLREGAGKPLSAWPPNNSVMPGLDPGISTHTGARYADQVRV